MTWSQWGPSYGYYWWWLAIILRPGSLSVKSELQGLQVIFKQTWDIMTRAWSGSPEEFIAVWLPAAVRMIKSAGAEKHMQARLSSFLWDLFLLSLSLKKKKNICALYLRDLTRMFLEDGNICCQWQKPTPGINPGKRDECIVCQSQGIKCSFTVPICHLQMEALTALH